MKRSFKPRLCQVRSFGVDEIGQTRRAIKHILAASGAISVSSLCESVRNYFKQKRRVKIDVGQSVVALRQLVAEGDVQRDGDDVWLTKHKAKLAKVGP